MKDVVHLPIPKLQRKIPIQIMARSNQQADQIFVSSKWVQSQFQWQPFCNNAYQDNRKKFQVTRGVAPLELNNDTMRNIYLGGQTLSPMIHHGRRTCYCAKKHHKMLDPNRPESLEVHWNGNWLSYSPNLHFQLTFHSYKIFRLIL